jgi:hypothetical protein
MSHVSQSHESASRKTLWVVGVAILLVCVEASWKNHSPDQTGTRAPAARHVVISNDQRAPDHAVYRAADDHTVSFSLKAGDSCVYIDDADSTSHDSNTGSPLVPVFCPARGAGWASLSYLTQSDPARAH